ncbi:MAG: putative ski2-type helicase [Methanoregula sp. PtaU1.Bin051]|nr:MAG: putative ski2-type helicase [Methanoregula sp. PtaU1.Bin051]
MLHESLQTILSQRMGWTELREVQEHSYKAVTDGNDVLIIAPTAGGKSEAALIPVIDNLLRNGWPGIACLYLSPLKALINDQEERFSNFCLPTGLTLIKWHGDVPKGDRSWKEGETPHILMITPESLEVLLHEPKLTMALKNLRFVIIDELHAFVESERGVHVKTLLYRLDRIAKHPIQRLGLSATVGNPDEILSWLSDHRHGEELVAIPAPAKQKRFSFIIEAEEPGRMESIIRYVSGKKALVFVNSRREAENIMGAISSRVGNVHIHHSSVSTPMRKAAEEAFSKDGGACIICTSTLELGIDIGDLDVVVQVGPPSSVSSFLQRMGRSGRRGKAAHVVWVLEGACELLCSVAILECAMHHKVEPLRPLRQPYNVLAQQMLLYLHRTKRTTRKQLKNALRALPPFTKVSPSVIGNLISHAIEYGYITTDGDMLMLGEQSEQAFGMANYRDLYSVISRGETFRAVTPDGEIVGTLDARFVSGKSGGDFSLGGRVWQMIKYDEGHNLVVVVPGSEQTSRAFWTGGGYSGFSPLVCAAVQEIIARKGTALPLPIREQEVLAGRIRRLPGQIPSAGLCVQERKIGGKVEVIVFSFNGAAFNRLLTILLSRQLGGKVKVRYSDFIVLIRNAGKDGIGQKVFEALLAIRDFDQDMIRSYLPVLPANTWKFGSVLPANLLEDLVMSEHYNIMECMATLRAADVILLGNEEKPPMI